MLDRLCPVVRESYVNKWSHIPSALSMYDYISVIFDNQLIDVSKGDRVIIGKPHGSQAYYIPWKRNGLISSYDNLNTVLKYGEVDFVDYTIDILGDAIGVGAGVAFCNKDTKTWINIGDAVLQMGNALEAIQTIGHKKIDNIILTIDYNNAQRCGRCDDILSIEPVFDFMANYGWDVILVEDGHDHKEILQKWNQSNFSKPTAFVFKTIKGNGYSLMIEDIMKWHYKTLDEKDIRYILSKD